jgi:hypothetical protein
MVHDVSAYISLLNNGLTSLAWKKTSSDTLLLRTWKGKRGLFEIVKEIDARALFPIYIHRASREMYVRVIRNMTVIVEESKSYSI